MLDTSTNKQFPIYSEHILSFLFLLIAQTFFKIHCEKFFEIIGSSFVFVLYSLCFFFVYKLHKYIDINLIKLFQPFIIALLTIDLAYEKSAGGLSLIMSGFYFIILNLVSFNTMIKQKESSLKSVSIFYVISIILAVTISYILERFVISYYVTSDATIFFQLYYLLSIVSCFLVGNHELILPFSKNIHEKKYLFSKFIIGTFILCKILLFFGFANTSTLFGITYTAITMIMILLYRHKKEYFILVNLLVVVLSLLPGNFTEIYFDPLVVSLITCLFYLKSPVLLKKSSKYGELVVSYRYRTRLKTLYHNNIVHGVEPIDYAGGECQQQTLTGSFRRGALLSVLDLFRSSTDKIAVLGMGVGMIASLLKKDQKLTFHEIDPNMKYIAVNSGLFNYIRKSPAQVDIRLGHARKTLNKDENIYDLIIVDTYQGRKVVSEFMTKEAFESYFSKLSEKGVVAIHLTSGDKNNEMIVASICRDLGLEGIICYRSSDDQEYSETVTGLEYTLEKKATGSASAWVSSVTDLYESFKKNPQSLSRDAYIVWAAIAKDRKNFGKLSDDPRWHKLRINDNVKSPTDKDAKFEIDSIITKEIE